MGVNKFACNQKRRDGGQKKRENIWTSYGKPRKLCIFTCVFSLHMLNSKVHSCNIKIAYFLLTSKWTRFCRRKSPLYFRQCNVSFLTSNSHYISQQIYKQLYTKRLYEKRFWLLGASVHDLACSETGKSPKV